MVHTAFDLELEQPKTNPQTPDSVLDKEKIIQLGFVVYKLGNSLEILETGCYNINIGVPISKFIQKLTGISNEDVANGISLQEAVDHMVAIMNKHKSSAILNQWGGGDDGCLKQELPTYNLGRARNIKHIYQVYASANGISIYGGLKKSLSRVGIYFDGKAHNAEVDAINTAKMHHFLFSKFKGS